MLENKCRNRSILEVLLKQYIVDITVYVHYSEFCFKSIHILWTGLGRGVSQNIFDNFPILSSFFHASI